MKAKEEANKEYSGSTVYRSGNANLTSEERSLVIRSIGLADPASNNCDDRFAGIAPVNMFPANAFGLHSMIGNVWEWTQDCYNTHYDETAKTGESIQAGRCSLRVRRGGAFDTPLELARFSDRSPADIEGRFKDTGFRVARDLN